jgi:hypothetical protein
VKDLWATEPAAGAAAKVFRVSRRLRCTWVINRSSLADLSLLKSLDPRPSTSQGQASALKKLDPSVPIIDGPCKCAGVSNGRAAIHGVLGSRASRSDHPRVRRSRCGGNLWRPQGCDLGCMPRKKSVPASPAWRGAIQSKLNNKKTSSGQVPPLGINWGVRNRPGYSRSEQSRKPDRQASVWIYRDCQALLLRECH